MQVRKYTYGYIEIPVVSAKLAAGTRTISFCLLPILGRIISRPFDVEAGVKATGTGILWPAKQGDAQIPGVRTCLEERKVRFTENSR